MTIEQPGHSGALVEGQRTETTPSGSSTHDAAPRLTHHAPNAVATAALYSLSVSGVLVEVARKSVKHLQIGVYPPDGAVRVTAPLAMPPEAIHVAVVSRLPWIRRQRALFEEQQRESPREMVSGESHWVFGRRVRLSVEPASGRTQVFLRGHRALVLQIAPERSAEDRLAALQRWYRAELRAVLAPLIQTWAARLGVQPRGWRIQRMKTRWGSCSPRTHRLLFNLELAKKPRSCIEYIVVHELAHLLAPTHDTRFYALLDQHMPNWRMLRRELGLGPLGV